MKFIQSFSFLDDPILVDRKPSVKILSLSDNPSTTYRTAQDNAGGDQD